VTDRPERRLDASTQLAVERTFLAHERTLMAWVRTAISLIGFGFSIQQFFRVARASLPPDDRLITPNVFGFLMMAIGLLALAIATIQNQSDLRMLQGRYPSDVPDQLVPRSRARILAALVALLGIVGLLSLLLRQ
jgi:putative membrane protein